MSLPSVLRDNDPNRLLLDGSVVALKGYDTTERKKITAVSTSLLEGHTNVLFDVHTSPQMKHPVDGTIADVSLLPLLPVDGDDFGTDLSTKEEVIFEKSLTTAPTYVSLRIKDGYGGMSLVDIQVMLRKPFRAFEGAHYEDDRVPTPKTFQIYGCNSPNEKVTFKDDISHWSSLTPILRAERDDWSFMTPLSVPGVNVTSKGTKLKNPKPLGNYNHYVLIVHEWDYSGCSPDEQCTGFSVVRPVFQQSDVARLDKQYRLLLNIEGEYVDLSDISDEMDVSYEKKVEALEEKYTTLSKTIDSFGTELKNVQNAMLELARGLKEVKDCIDRLKEKQKHEEKTPVLTERMQDDIIEVCKNVDVINMAVGYDYIITDDTSTRNKVTTLQLPDACRAGDRMSVTHMLEKGGDIHIRGGSMTVCHGSNITPGLTTFILDTLSEKATFTYSGDKWIVKVS